MCKEKVTTPPSGQSLDNRIHLVTKLSFFRSTLGRKVRAKTGDAIHEGIAESVARDGSLLLRGLDGNLTRIVAGDVTLHN